MKLWRWLYKAMMNNPKQIVCEKQAEVTYEELIMFAQTFSEKIKGEKNCAILCASGIMSAIAMLSCFAAHVTATPVAVKYGAAHCHNILDFIRPTAILTDLSGELQIIRLSKEKYVEPDISPALILCTSGSTGTPKGVMLSEDNILANTRDICKYFDITGEDSVLISRPLYHSSVVAGEFIVSLLKGCKICFCLDDFNPQMLLKSIRDNWITVFGGTPTMLRMMAKFRRGSEDTMLRIICVSGECMSEQMGRDIAAAFPTASIYHVYGLTEASPRVMYLPTHEFSRIPDSVGIPLDSVSVKLLKSNGKCAQINEEGVLWVKGPNVMLGYYKAPQQTAAVLCDGWLCTNDIAVVDENGFYKIRGRADDMIIRAGVNIYPQEIEGQIKTDSRVDDVLVYGYTDTHGVKIGMKIVGAFESVGEVRKMCLELLPKFQMPTKIELVTEIPKTISGKMKRGFL